MRTLYEIDADLRALEDLLYEQGGELCDEENSAAIDAWFASLGAERDKKIDNYCCLIREFEAKADARMEESARIEDLARADMGNAQQLKARLKHFLESHDLKKLETARFKLSVAGNGGLTPIVFPEQWSQEPASAPEAFQRRVIELDTHAIREAIRNDEESYGTCLGERGTHLRIK